MKYIFYYTLNFIYLLIQQKKLLMTHIKYSRLMNPKIKKNSTFNQECNSIKGFLNMDSYRR